MSENSTPVVPCAFEIEPFKTKLTGEIEAYITDDENEGPASVIDCDHGGTVVVKWNIEGPLRDHLCGEWCVTAYLESIGPGPEIALPGPSDCECVKWEPCHKGGWEKRIKIPPKAIECTPCGSLYQIGVTVTSKDGCGNPGHIAAFCKSATVMFYMGSSHDD